MFILEKKGLKTITYSCILRSYKEQIKPKVSRSEEIIKIRSEIKRKQTNGGKW